MTGSLSAGSVSADVTALVIPFRHGRVRLIVVMAAHFDPLGGLFQARGQAGECHLAMCQFDCSN
jgi:hypothetical protein